MLCASHDVAHHNTRYKDWINGVRIVRRCYVCTKIVDNGTVLMRCCTALVEHMVIACHVFQLVLRFIGWC